MDWRVAIVRGRDADDVGKKLAEWRVHDDGEGSGAWTMNPFFFGRSEHQLFGAYEPAVNGRRDAGVVLCPPLGREFLIAHPTYRLLARRLAAAGHHVLRLDYHGTGDSAGEFEDTHQSHWLEDIDAAIVELKDIAHVSRVALVGVRYGGTLAACAAGVRDDVHRLVLWDAIVDGARYLGEIGAAHREFEEHVDAAGVVLNSQARADIRSTTLGTFGASLPPTLVAVSAADPEPYRALVTHLQGHGVDATLQHAADVCPWLEGRVGVMRLPVTTVESVVAWLS